MGKQALKLLAARTIEELRLWREKLPVGKIGFVPTMGALHEGHMALVQAASKTCDHVIVSIFVNPLQFGPNEDFSKYPRVLEQDLGLCEKYGVAAVFHPSVDVIYPNGQVGITTVQPPIELISGLCGAFRPGHFVGVATVVNSLLNIVRPDYAFFGEKDYQQLQVIKHMVNDLNMQVQIVGVPTVRENDGLALSSRNAYLSDVQRKLAPQIYNALTVAKDAIRNGSSIADAVAACRARLSALEGVTVQYFECSDPVTLQPVSDPKAPSIVLVAAKYGDVRLIDNLLVHP
ncbi:pantoate--beta-alanine ligase [soil metagenome]